ncbi:hypothetical protein [Flavobacterium suncheonense]|uniref:Uncharacterized protein n=1 Tax=Flavobacterium suncheonense GH29-5 = DSM 17707 TaxID=1121899 RepID=A0A0A2MC61_9FLAO|nr:hypothetical protein [Flavobacterium suncheonense]KGO89869.1 hypothetical protein Q764_04465 [Flavobacterium suncheonense GH29-5 = DSM 17707]
MLLKPTDIREKLILKRQKTGIISEQLASVEKILAENEAKRSAIRKKLSSKNQNTENAFVFDLLETENIFHIDQIKAICIDYRLRFLDSHLYKVPFPEEVITKISHLEKRHHTTLSGFKLMAPSKVFQLKKYNDPILFAPIGNDYYYLIHKWGNDLHPLRKWLVLPFRNLGWLLLTLVLISVLCSMALPDNFYGKAEPTTFRLISFLFLFKYWCAIAIYFFVSKGKNFNVNIWNSNFGG